ncbi:phosphatase PAP2 family protein [Methylobacillus gramineus]|uniref:phosphatase PAP2 family protein n=1 Tax=Methylobacillus gramineus TaxID=755169 RepID=UPI001CFFB351|nr:phosphatase PAP2 family protein [Methylobacillus gramineus]MCB5184957.1 phosphatase PAP2 family protein [Methylobacillus gramineus]
MVVDNAMSSLPYRTIVSGLLISALLLLFLEHFTEMDLQLEDWFFDKHLNDFPWRNAWFATDFAHEWLKSIIINSGLLMLALVIIDRVYRIRQISDFVRYRLQLIALSSVLVPAVIRGLKRHSALSCPWEIERYGGHLPYLKMFDHIPVGWHAGHCFPAGHASTGLWLASIAVFWLPHNPRKAAWVFIGGLSIGLSMGWIQQMRGAHFLSHTLWSGWVAIMVIFLLTLAYRNKIFKLSHKQ